MAMREYTEMRALVSSLWSKPAVRFGLVVLLTIIVLVLPLPEGLSELGRSALAAFVFTGGMFSLQPVSLPFASLLVVAMLVFLGVANAEQAFSPLSRPIVFLILGSLFLGEALRKYGVTRRLALMSIVTSRGVFSRLLLGLMVIAAGLSMFMENTATAAVLLPVALSISSQVVDRERARELNVLLVLGISFAASLGGMVTIMGAASNAVASDYLSKIQPWGFVDWVIYGGPAFLVVFPATWLLLLRVKPPPMGSLDISQARRELAQLGHASAGEKEVLATLAVTVLLWISGSAVERWLGLSPTFMSPAIIGIAAVGFLSLRGRVEWEDVKGVSWGFLFTIMAGLALGDALNRSGATEWLIGGVAPLLMDAPLIVLLVVLVFSSTLLTNVLNNATVVAIFAPLIVSFAELRPDLNAVQLLMPLALATTFGYMLPSASGRMALIASTGLLKPREMLDYGFVVSMMSALLLVVEFFILTAVGLW